MIKTLSDLRREWGVGGNTLAKRVSYWLKTGKMSAVRRGLYRLGKYPDAEAWSVDESWKAANSLQSPSYVSFETVLAAEGVLFQFAGAVQVAAPRTARYFLRLGGPSVEAQQMPAHLLILPLGLKSGGGWTAATPERAVADVIYRSPGYHFDDTSRLDPDLLVRLAAAYRPYSKRTADTLISFAADHEKGRVR